MEMIKKMTPAQTFTTSVILILAIASVTANSFYLDNTRESRLLDGINDQQKAVLETIQQASEQETERMRILTEAVKESKVATAVKNDVREFHWTVTKAATKADVTKVNGVEVKREVAEVLVKKPKTKPTGTQVNGLFKILGINWESRNITLQKVDTFDEYTANFDANLLPEESKEIIKNAEWGDRVFSANLNVRVAKDGSVVDSDLVRVAEYSPE